jgi:phosphoribosylanthranilate isomerase
MKIKVCGLKYPENVLAVTALQPDYIGFIFYGPSPRFVGEQVNLIPALPSSIKKTAVFVNESPEKIVDLINNCGFDAIQLHGSESPEFCGQLKRVTTVIKAFGVSEQFDFNKLQAYAANVDYFLFDTKTVIHGGSGESFDWALLQQYRLNIPFFLSGGISLDNLGEIGLIDHPQFFGVDLNSRFETSPGLKDINRLEKAFDLIKNITNEVRG